MKTGTTLLGGLISALTISLNAQPTTATVTTTSPNQLPPPGTPIAGYVASNMKWTEAPAGFPSGAQMVVLQGDPNRAGIYTIRLKLPAGYRIPLHTHDSELGVTVISGLLHIGIAPTYDAANSKEIGSQSFATLPAKMRHTGWTDVETVVQITGIGPLTMREAYPSGTARTTQ
jgi:hypothetical protein